MLYTIVVLDADGEVSYETITVGMSYVEAFDMSLIITEDIADDYTVLIQEYKE